MFKTIKEFPSKLMALQEVCLELTYMVYKGDLGTPNPPATSCYRNLFTCSRRKMMQKNLEYLSVLTITKTARFSAGVVNPNLHCSHKKTTPQIVFIQKCTKFISEKYLEKYFSFSQLNLLSLWRTFFCIMLTGLH